MAFNPKQAREALRASGASMSSLLALAWPFGRQARIRSLVRKRRAVLDTKNSVVDYLFRAQRPLAQFCISRKEQMQAALADPKRRPAIMAVAVNRDMLEEYLSTRGGSEGGRSLDQALAELDADGVILRMTADLGHVKQNLYFSVQNRRRPFYNLSGLDALLQQDRNLVAELRERLRRDSSTGSSRSYRLK